MNANRFHFRCWDKDQKFFVTSALEITGGSFSSRTHVLAARHHDFILMQSTGRYAQCKGSSTREVQELFEGDIVEFKGKHGDIWWQDSSCRFCVNSDYGLTFDISCSLELTIIGNIYENPELLEKGCDK